MMDQIAAANSWLNGYVWGWPMIVLLLGTGVLLTVLTAADGPWLTTKHSRSVFGMFSGTERTSLSGEWLAGWPFVRRPEVPRNHQPRLDGARCRARDAGRLGWSSRAADGFHREPAPRIRVRRASNPDHHEVPSLMDRTRPSLRRERRGVASKASRMAESPPRIGPVA